MTNGDRIRAMTDEELAEFLCGMMTADQCAQSCPARERCYYGHNGMVEWLQQPAEVENDR